VEEGGGFSRRWGLLGGRFGFEFGVGFLVLVAGLRSCSLLFVRVRVSRGGGGGGGLECRGVFSLFGHCSVGGVELD